MCEFFSFVHDGKKIYYFDGEQRKNGVKMPDGNQIGSYDSHSSITCYYKLDDDGVNKFEYNPYTDKLVLDGKTICEWDERTIREQLAGIDWQPIAGDVEGAREFIRGLKDIPWLKPDGTVEDSEEIKVFETKCAANDAARAACDAYDVAFTDVWNAAYNAARDAAMDAAKHAPWAAAYDAAWDVAHDNTWAAAKAAAYDAAKHAPWAATWAAVYDAAKPAPWAAAKAAAWEVASYCAMHFVCGDLKIDEKHREHIRKRFAIWQHGYGVLCDVNGIIYAYKKIN